MIFSIVLFFVIIRVGNCHHLYKFISQLRLLPACFGVAPAYAHLARLSGVRRPEGRATYQRESARTFRSVKLRSGLLYI